MAGSRRRLKRNAPKVKVGTAANKRKRTEKTKVPLEVTQDRPDVRKKLKKTYERGTQGGWLRSLVAVHAARAWGVHGPHAMGLACMYEECKAPPHTSTSGSISSSLEQDLACSSLQQ